MMKSQSTKEELRGTRKAFKTESECGRGYRRHSVAMELSSGEALEEFEIEHRARGVSRILSRIEKHHKKSFVQ